MSSTATEKAESAHILLFMFFWPFFFSKKTKVHIQKSLGQDQRLFQQLLFHHSTLFLCQSTLSWIISTVSRDSDYSGTDKCDWWEIRTLKHLSVMQSDWKELLWNCLACLFFLFFALKIETTGTFLDLWGTKFYPSFLLIDRHT